MSIVNALNALGFKDAAIVNEKDGVSVIRVWTSKGWAYDRLPSDASDDAVAAWAKGKAPGE